MNWFSVLALCKGRLYTRAIHSYFKSPLQIQKESVYYGPSAQALCLLMYTRGTRGLKQHVLSLCLVTANKPAHTKQIETNAMILYFLMIDVFPCNN